MLPQLKEYNKPGMHYEPTLSLRPTAFAEFMIEALMREFPRMPRPEAIRYAEFENRSLGKEVGLNLKRFRVNWQNDLKTIRSNVKSGTQNNIKAGLPRLNQATPEDDTNTKYVVLGFPAGGLSKHDEPSKLMQAGAVDTALLAGVPCPSKIVYVHHDGKHAAFVLAFNGTSDAQKFVTDKTWNAHCSHVTKTAFNLAQVDRFIAEINKKAPDSQASVEAVVVSLRPRVPIASASLRHVSDGLAQRTMQKEGPFLQLYNVVLNVILAEKEVVSRTGTLRAEHPELTFENVKPGLPHPAMVLYHIPAIALDNTSKQVTPQHLDWYFKAYVELDQVEEQPDGVPT